LAGTLACLVGLAMVADTLDLLDLWAKQRASVAGTLPSQLPQTTGWPDRQHQRSGLMSSDYSTHGALDMVLLAKLAPTGGVIGLVLEDARQDHLIAGATLADRPLALLSANLCCGPNMTIETCTAKVWQQSKRSGGRLLLPRLVPDDKRLAKPDDLNFLQGLLKAQPEALQQHGRYWWVLEGQGKGPLPCTAPLDGGNPWQP